MKSANDLKAFFRQRKWLPAIFLVGLSVGFYQNCSKVTFNTDADSLRESSSISGNSQTVYADFNTPISFTALFSVSVSNALKFSMPDGTAAYTFASGSTLTINDATKLTMTYVPANGFRSTEQATVILKDEYGNQTADVITFVVASTIHDINPAMAVRTSGCITCHASVASNYITDFGAGSSYFFGAGAGGNPLVGSSEALYSDRYPDMSWLSATFSSGVIIPKQTLGFDLASAVQTFLTSNQIVGSTYIAAANDVVANIKPTNTLGDYLAIMENHKAVSDASNIQQMTSVYIGAPTAAVIKTKTQIGTARTRYLKNNTSTSADLSGLVDKGTYFQADNLVCDGDLVVTAPLYLHNLTLRTDNGCRIYSTASIFVNGPITYQQITPSTTDNTNLQLESAEWINMGVGITQCESVVNPGWYYTNNLTGASEQPFHLRMITYAAPTRVNPTAATALAFNSTTLQTEEQSIAGFLDASCEAGSTPRAVSYSRLLMNAPRIDSRYTGQVTGVIISEVAIFGLQTFAFTFDPVFDRVPILPFLDQSDYLSVTQ